MFGHRGTTKDNSNGTRRYDIKGYERSSCITKNGCERIVHVLTVSGPVDRIVQQMVPAFRMVHNRHPKMRALMSELPDEPMTAYIQPPFTSDDQVANLVTVLQPHGAPFKQEKLRQLMEEVCNRPVDRTENFPCFLMLHVAKDPSDTDEKGVLTILLFSEHTFFDGYSGLIVLNELLLLIRLQILLAQKKEGSQDYESLKKQLDELCEELPLRPPLYDQIMGPPSFLKSCKEKLIDGYYQRVYRSEFKEFEPILTTRDDQKDLHCVPFPVNKSYCLMDSGAKDNLESALETCRKEKVTLNGAIVACVMMAHVKAKYQNLESIPAEPNFKIDVVVSFNMRNRVKAPFPELTVGNVEDSLYLPPFSDDEVDLSSRFWDLARQTKDLTDAELDITGLTEMIFYHYNFNATSVWDLQMRKGIVGDVHVSNLGRYPFAPKHDLEDLGAISVDGLYFYCSAPHVGYNADFFVVSTDRLYYTMASKMSDQDGKELFKYLTKSVEAISSIGSDETLLQACERLLGADE